MYPFGSLTAELQSARRKLLDVFEVPDSKATGERIHIFRQGVGARSSIPVACSWLAPQSIYIFDDEILPFSPNDRHGYARTNGSGDVTAGDCRRIAG
jgi:hypothetical protein